MKKSGGGKKKSKGGVPGTYKAFITKYPVLGKSHEVRLTLVCLLAGGHLLGDQRGLDPVEQALEPADELSLRDAQLGVGRGDVIGERQRETFEFLLQFGGEAVLEFPDRRPVDVAQAVSRRLVERCGLHLLEQLLDHRADAHHLGRLLHELSGVA